MKCKHTIQLEFREVDVHTLKVKVEEGLILFFNFRPVLILVV
jgi:hypothetical protein